MAEVEAAGGNNMWAPAEAEGGKGEQGEGDASGAGCSRGRMMAGGAHGAHGYVQLESAHGGDAHRVSHLVGAQPGAARRQHAQHSRVLRAVGAGVALAVCALALVGGAGAGSGVRGGRAPAVLDAMSMGPAGSDSPLFAQAFDEQNADPAATKMDAANDAMASGPAGSASPLFAQASDEQGGNDPGGVGGNSSGVNEMPDAIKAWLEDMKKKVSIDPTDTVNVSVPHPPPLPPSARARTALARASPRMLTDAACMAHCRCRCAHRAWGSSRFRRRSSLAPSRPRTR
jgi:hypothetical protein